MRLRDGRYECANCGVQLDVTPHGEPNATIHAAGGKPNVRVLKVDGREIHRCEVEVQRQRRRNKPTP
jgi:hypothetical protein